MQMGGTPGVGMHNTIKNCKEQNHHNTKFFSIEQLTFDKIVFRQFLQFQLLQELKRFAN